MGVSQVQGLVSPENARNSERVSRAEVRKPARRGVLLPLAQREHLRPPSPWRCEARREFEEKDSKLKKLKGVQRFLVVPVSLEFWLKVGDVGLPSTPHKRAQI